MLTRSRIRIGVAAGLIAAYFVALTRGALGAYYSPDDSMNLYRSWCFPLSSLFKANLLFFLNSEFIRPMGSVWYRSIFYFAGFHPQPFHIANLILIAANAWITYAVVRRLTGSRETGAIAALLICYHPGLAGLYYDTGLVYDVLCYFFYFAAILFYLRARRDHRALSGWELAAFLALYICALNSKEMAVTLPAFLFLYEALYEQSPFRSPRGFPRWLLHEGRAILAASCVTLLFAIGRAFSRNSLLAIDPYKPEFTFHRFMATNRGWINTVFVHRDAFNSVAVGLLWILLFTIAWQAKSRALKFAWFFVMLSPIPIAFIAPRQGPQYYVPFFGWVLYAAAALAEGSQWLIARLARPLREALAPARGPALFVLLLLTLYPLYRSLGLNGAPAVASGGEMYRSVVGQIHQLRPALRRGARVLFLDDPIQPHWNDLTFLVRLSYRDDTLVVDRANSMDHAPDAKQIASYDYVFDYRRGTFFDSPQPPEPAQLLPAFGMEFDRPAVYHSDWRLVTPLAPARPGESLIARAINLGPTAPLLPPGQLFPKSPLSEVTGRVQVRVAGQDAQVYIKIGWPDLSNAYRVDFRLPDDTPRGEANLNITVRDATGPDVTIPIR